MSNVPPSPAMTISFDFLPCLFRAASIPEATAALHSNATWMYGTRHALHGYCDETISLHDVALEIIVFGPAARSMFIMTFVIPHPAHAVWPQEKSSPIIITAWSPQT